MDVSASAMDDETFWRIIEMLDWSHEGDDDKVVEPAVAALAAMSESEIIGFDRALAYWLYVIDGREWARESGSMIWWGEPDRLSVDGFLYARCAVVASGLGFYSVVLRDAKQMPKDVEFEALLYIGRQAFERATGRELDDQGPISFETFSNRDQWP